MSEEQKRNLGCRKVYCGGSICDNSENCYQRGISKFSSEFTFFEGLNFFCYEFPIGTSLGSPVIGEKPLLE